MQKTVALRVVAGLFVLATAHAAFAQSQTWDKLLAGTRRFAVLDAFGDAAVLDKETGLVWERAPGDTDNDGVRTFQDLVSWHEASTYCGVLTVANRRGWRLPTRQELSTLLDPTIPAPGPALPPGHPFDLRENPFGGADDFWTATSSALDAIYAHAIDVAGANAYLASKTLGQSNVWCVRGGSGVDAQ